MDITEIAMLGAVSGFVITYILEKIKLKKSIMKFADPILSAIFAFFMLWVFKDSSFPQIKEIVITCTSSIFNNLIINEKTTTKLPLLNTLFEKAKQDKEKQDKEKQDKEKQITVTEPTICISCGKKNCDC